MAVANSLAISSSQSSANFDPRVFQYLQHQHQILHQHQQQLLMASQHPANRPAIVPPGYTNIRSAAGMWIRPSDWKYPPGGQYTFPRQVVRSSRLHDKPGIISRASCSHSAYMYDHVSQSRIIVSMLIFLFIHFLINE